MSIILSLFILVLLCIKDISSFSRIPLLFSKSILKIDATIVKQPDYKHFPVFMSLSNTDIEKISSLIHSSINETNMNIHSLSFQGNKLELLLKQNESTDGISSPNIEDIQQFHTMIYSKLEQDPLMASTLENIEITMSSVGISDQLNTDKEFITFKVHCAV